MTAPDYFNRLRAFVAYTAASPDLRNTDIVLYYVLLALANKYNELSFPAKRQEILDLSKLNPRTYLACRERLSNLGLIEFQEGSNGNKMAVYTLLPIVQRCNITPLTAPLSTPLTTPLTAPNNILIPNPIPKEEEAPPSPPKKVKEGYLTDWQPTVEKKKQAADWPKAFSAEGLQNLITVENEMFWDAQQKNFGEQLDMHQALKDWSAKNAGLEYNDKRHPRDSFTLFLKGLVQKGGNRQQQQKPNLSLQEKLRLQRERDYR